MKNERIIYVFDFFGEFIECLPFYEVAEKYLNGNSFSLNNYIKRNGIYKKFYYFLETKEFIVKHKKAEHNPFLQKDRTYKKREERNITKYTHEDKLQIVNKVKPDKFFAEKYNVSVGVIYSLRSKWRYSV